MSYNSKYKGSEVEYLLGLIPNKQDKVLKFEDVVASNWVADSTYSDFPYRCDITCSGVTSSDYAEVIFGLAEAVSANYAPVCETATNVVRIWSKENASIVVPTIIVTKL